MKKFSLLSLNLFIVFATVGCGNIMTPRNYQVDPNVYNVSSNLDYDEEPADKYSCPSISNVIPESSGTSINMNSGSIGQVNFYKVCKSAIQGNESDLLVRGSTANSRSICVFPLRQTTAGIPMAIYGRDGQPIVQCAPIASGGAAFSFPANMATNMNFNTVAIVESLDEYAMIYCVRNQFMSSYCPNYSIGAFR